MIYKIILYVILFLCLSIGFGQLLSADNPPTGGATSSVARSSPLFERIALCESGNNPHAKNPYSSASGRFQFLHGTWYHYGLEFWGEDFYSKNIWDYDNNTELAWYVFNKYGSRDWNASKSCWKTTDSPVMVDT